MATPTQGPDDGDHPNTAFTCNGLEVKILEDDDGDGDIDCDDFKLSCNGRGDVSQLEHIDTDGDGDFDCNDLPSLDTEAGQQYGGPGGTTAPPQVITPTVDTNGDGDIDCDDIDLADYSPGASCNATASTSASETANQQDSGLVGAVACSNGYEYSGDIDCDDLYGLLPDGWASMTVAEKVALNPFDCLADDNDIHISAETGECLWDLYVYNDSCDDCEDYEDYEEYEEYEEAEEEDSVTLEELQAYMLEDHTWQQKRNILEEFVIYSDPQSLECTSTLETDWSTWLTAQRNASGNLRIYLDGFISYFDGIDVQAMFDEPRTITDEELFTKYGLDFDEFYELEAELSVRNKVLYTVDDVDNICTYDIDYNLPE